MADETDRFVPANTGSTALFIDTSAFFSYFYPRDERHADAAEIFRALGGDQLSYRPVFTNDYVLDETVTRLGIRSTHGHAERALAAIYESDIVRMTHVSEPIIDGAVDAFRTYDDHGTLSFTDHVIAVHADELEVDHIFSYDGDFQTFGLTVIPHFETEDT